MDDIRSDWQSLLDALHASPFRVALVVAGGGAGAMAECFRHSGASNTFVDACIPYSRRSMSEYLGGSPDDSSASGITARQLAKQAYARAQGMDDREQEGHYAGVALVAALPTIQPRRGADRIHVALHTHQASTLWSLELEKGCYTRETAEVVADALFKVALAELAGHESAGSSLPDLNVERDVERFV